MNSAVAAARCAALLIAGLGLAAANAGAADAVPPARAPAPSPLDASAEADRAGGAGEPAVRRTVIQDDSARIDELRVRGQVTRITVDPKGRAPAYEIITVDGSRDLSDGPSPSRGAAGKRVWNVFRF